MRLESFGPEDIVIPDRLRKSLNETAVQGLMESIQKIGLQSPPTVRWAGDDVVLVAGRHRLEALRRLGTPLVQFEIFKGDERDARLWEIAENLHRSELTVQERAEHIAEWVRLAGERTGATCTNSSKPGPKGAIREAERELGIEHTEAVRAVKIAGLSSEAKEAARETGRDNNQSALLKAAAAAPEEQARVIREYAPAPRVKPAPAPLNDIETEEQWMSAIMRIWNRGAPQWRERFLSSVDEPVFDNTRAA